MVLQDKKIPATPAQNAVDHDEIGLEFGLSPIDLVEDPDADENGLGWMIWILILSSILLAMFNSFAIDKWARQLETTATTGPIKDAAAKWHGTMQSIGLDIPLEAGRELWRDAKEATFGDDGEASDGDLPPQPPAD